LIEATSGLLYGTTSGGGTSGNGTIFSLSVGLGPFVEIMPRLGKAGQIVEILGQGFEGTTAVSFNGTRSSFTVISDTLVRATVPDGATTGKVVVTTPNRTLVSDVAFRVRP
jgi:uncharacterized repeat protein (TIGR03803 family)